MAKKISFNNRLGYARRELLKVSQSANTIGLRNEARGMRKMLRIFEGEHDETIKAKMKHGPGQPEMVPPPEGGGE